VLTRTSRALTEKRSENNRYGEEDGGPTGEKGEERRKRKEDRSRKRGGRNGSLSCIIKKRTYCSWRKSGKERTEKKKRKTLREYVDQGIEARRN